MKKAVYIVAGRRTPFLKMKGEPGPFSAADLGVSAAKALLANQPFAPSALDQVIVGCAAPSEEEANIARVISLRAGCGDRVTAWTVQRNCASGLQAIDSGFQSILAERSDLVLVGGCEAMSRAPLLLNTAMVTWLSQLRKQKRWIEKLKLLLQLRPHFFVPVVALLKGLTDPVVDLTMGQTAEELAYLFKISREDMDAFAWNSHQRALRAQTQKEYHEIAPLYGMDGTVYEEDDGIRSDTALDKLASLKPVFDKFGNITAGNSSQISDGAAFILLASEEGLKRHGLTPQAKILDIQWAGLDPTVMGLGPVYAMTPLLMRHRLSVNAIEHIEINEAFAAQVIACQRAWQDRNFCENHLGTTGEIGEWDPEKVNPDGGAIAIGHPVGASGARLTLHCVQRIQKNQHRYSMASLCIGGGQGGAILLEKVG